MNYASLVRGLLTVCTVILSCGTLACLIRAILGIRAGRQKKSSST